MENGDHGHQDENENDHVFTSTSASSNIYSTTKKSYYTDDIPTSNTASPAMVAAVAPSSSSSSSSWHDNDNEDESGYDRHTTVVVSFKTLWMKLCDGFSSLKGSPSELYYAYVLKFLDSYSYFSFSIIFTLFLSTDFYYSDITAGTLYGSWGALTTIYGLLTGFIIDNIGVSKSLRLGYGLSLLARIGIFITTSRVILLANILITLPLGTCLGIPVLTTGIRRYTDNKNRGFAFGLFYVVMNVAALLSGPVVDVLTIWYKGEDKNDNNRSIIQSSEGGTTDDTTITPPPITWTLSSYRAIILTGIVANIIACLVTLTIREIKVQNTDGRGGGGSSSNNNDNAATDNGSFNTATSTTAIATIGSDDEPASMAVPPSPSPPRGVATFRPLTGSPTQILSETCRSPSFRRFLLVCLIMLNVRMVFRHLDATLPKYMIREFGPDVPKGTIYAINPALIIILVPIVTAATSHVEPLVMMHYGSYISAASVFVLAFSTSIWACIVFVTVLSIGESIWSPRLYDYSVSVCREGREGTYMALTSAPLFLAKLPVGALSGLLLQRYCPEDGERNSQVMWLIIGLLTSTSPVFMTCCWSYISRKSNDDEEPDNVNYTELQTRPVA
jgi:proton-dependent oligopeptide transporter, POT family